MMKRFFGIGMVLAALGCDANQQAIEEVEAPPVCGDGLLDSTEACDDGNTEDGDGCSAECTLPVCGDGLAEPGELCFDAAKHLAFTGGVIDLTFADIDRNGALDVISVGELFTEVLFTGVNRIQSFKAGEEPSSVAVGDINKDGRLDVVTAYAGSDAINIAFQSLSGDLEISPVDSSILNNVATFPDPASLALGDLNADGALDIVTADAGFNGVSIFLGNGDGTLQAQRFEIVGQRPVAVALADLDRDGTLDIVTANAGENRVAVLLGQGNGDFAPLRTFAAGAIPSSLALGDVNGDGALDIVVGNHGADFAEGDPNTASVLLGTGNGSFGPALSVVAGDQPAIALGDIDRDGRLDLVAANPGEDAVSVLLGTGDGHFGARRSFPTGQGPVSVELVDFNLDGALDIAVACFASDEVLLLASSPL
jgi:cysteine-rich repeat protein